MSNRDYMREYMRSYRAQLAARNYCVICGRGLTNRQTKYCGRSCRLKDYYQRHKDATLERYKRWARANRERAVARVRAWRLANPDRSRAYVRRWRTKPCPFCSGKLCWPAAACRKCSIHFGCVCHDNPNCGVIERHTHCPCGIPVAGGGHYKIQPCQFCLAEMERSGLSLSELFEQTRDLEEAA